MPYTRVELAAMVRRELFDNAAAPYWPTLEIYDALGAGFAAYSQYFPDPLEAQVTSAAGTQSVTLSGLALSVQAVTIDGVTVPQVPDPATLFEPAFRNQISQTLVQPVTPYGAAATHGQAWALFGGSVNLRYPLAAGRVVHVWLSAAWVFPTDDTTPEAMPDADIELPVLYACDRLWRSAASDAIHRGAPGAWVEGRGGLSDYMQRYRAALRDRRSVLRTRFMQAPL